MKVVGSDPALKSLAAIHAHISVDSEASVFHSARHPPSK
jgi:hypothetical protein